VGTWLRLHVCISLSAYQVYRGKWCNIDIAAKEYLAVDEDESTLALLQFNADQMSPEAARNRAKVSYAAGCYNRALAPRVPLGR